MNDTLIEKKRYDSRAEKKLKSDHHELENILPVYMNTPVCRYHEFLKTVPPGSKVLEIGAGMGENTECLLDLGFDVRSTDISEKSVEYLKYRFANTIFFQAEFADMEQLPFNENSFDVVCSAGSLSYGDNIKVMGEIHRVLVSGGSFIAIDSLNNNPIYKLNRYLHYMRGNRSKSTLKRMPTVDLINQYALKFSNLEVAYFGSITWLFPILKLFLTDDRILQFSNTIDRRLKITKSAFKFSLKATKL